MRQGKSTPNRANGQDFHWDDFMRACLANREQSILLCITTFSADYRPFGRGPEFDKVAEYKKELAEFYETEEVKRLLYPDQPTTARVTPPKPPRPAAAPPVLNHKTIKFKPALRLICINADVNVDYCGMLDEPERLQFLDRYTCKEALVYSNGKTYYFIDELDGTFDATRFYVSKCRKKIKN